LQIRRCFIRHDRDPSWVLSVVSSRVDALRGVLVQFRLNFRDLGEASGTCAL